MHHPSVVRRRFGAALLAVAALGSVSAARAADPFPIPGKPIVLVLPALGGSTGDRVLRMYGDRMRDEWKVPVIVEQKPGGGGVIGSQHVAKSAPDGHTILLGFSHLVQAPAFGQKRPYDALTDFIPIARIVDLPLLLLASDPSITSLKQYVEKAAANPGKFSYGSYGNATTSHIYSEVVNVRHKLGQAHSPYRGTPPLMADLLAGHISSAVIDVGNAMPHIQSGKVRPLGITGSKRSPLLPDVPTFQELGYPEMAVSGRYWLMLPAGTPPETVEKIRALVYRVQKSPEAQAQMTSMGLEPALGEREDVAANMRADIEYWRRVIQLTGIKAND